MVKFSKNFYSYSIVSVSKTETLYLEEIRISPQLMKVDLSRPGNVVIASQATTMEVDTQDKNAMAIDKGTFEMRF